MSSVNANTKYAYTREGSSVFSAIREKTFNDIEDKQANNGLTEIKPAASPNIKRIVLAVALTVTSLAVIAGVTAAVVLTLGDDDDSSQDATTTTFPPSPDNHQSTTESVENFHTHSSTHSKIDAATTTNSNTAGSSTTSSPTTATSDVLETTWLAWNAWLSCSVTCGSGIHRRYRSCNNTSSICTGNYIDTAICTEIACPVYGKWTTWSSWGSCDVTCGGGTQIRTRTCNRTDDTDFDCVGDSNQEKTCSDWSCPDCTRECAIGTLNAECDACICDNTIVHGQVVSAQTGKFLSNSFIYSADVPTTMLTKSNATGYFSLNASCISTQLLIIREGFVDATVIIDSNNIKVQMVKIALPYLTEAPKSMYRLTGETVYLCCNATAKPDIDYYEWFKNSLMIETGVSIDGTTLSIDNLTTSDSGSYQCRANSPYGAIMSPSATIDVQEDPNDFCKGALRQKITTLPDDCVQPDTNSSMYEVGECVPSACRLNSSNSRDFCGDESYSCCVMSETDIRTLHCSNYDIQVVVVKACGCASCAKPSLKISGTALDFDNVPVRYAEVWVNGVFETYTSRFGSFSFEASLLTDKITILIDDTFLQQYLPIVKVLQISPDMKGTLNVEMKLFRASEPLEIDSTEENTLVAGTTEQGSPIIQVDIPSNAFYNIDGTEYTGTVSASLTFLDPTNNSMFKNAPGLFKFTDAEGQQGDLASFGVFNLYFTNSEGQEVVLNEVVDFYTPNDIVSAAGGEEIKLWALNAENGIWDYISSGSNSERKKRQVARNWVGAIDFAAISRTQWLNYDVISYRSDACYYKIRLYNERSLTTAVTRPSARILVETITIANSNMRIIQAYINNPEDECIPTICDNIKAFIYAYYYDNTVKDMYAANPYIVATNNIIQYTLTGDEKALEITTMRSTDGPFFASEETCKISTPTESHLRCHYGHNTHDWQVLLEFTSSQGDIFNQIELSQMTWYPNRQEGYRVCFVKVKIDLAGNVAVNDLKLKTVSSVGTVTDFIGKVYGVRTVNIQSSQTVCIEYKCSGLFDPEFLSYENVIDYTHVKIQLDFPIQQMVCEVTSESSLVTADPPGTNIVQLGNIGGVYEFKAPVAGGSSMGVYYSTSDAGSYSNAESIALGTCQSGIDESSPEDQNFGVAVTFTCT